jgi:WD40 repeat protein
MKLIEGGTLSQRRLKSVEDVARVVGTVARAVHYAHQRGILHRDLKPTNILLDEPGEPHITDFGLAKLIEDDSGLTMSVGILGTPAYMAPEQARGGPKQLTTAADIYSLGALLYELLTGQPPFRAETAVETLRQICEQEPVAPSELIRRSGVNLTLDSDLETICIKCLNKDPQKRYSTAEMLALDLDRWCKGEPILARPVGAFEKSLRWCQRRPAVAGLLLALQIVFATGLAGIVWEWRRAEHNATAAADKLIEAYIAQAQATRGTDRAGRRFDSLAAVAKAASLKPSPAQRDALRTEAIASFGLNDFRAIKQWPVPLEGVKTWRFDTHLRLYARIAERREISVSQVVDDREIARMPSVGSSPEAINLFSPDSRFLVVSYEDKTNRVWEIARGNLMLEFPSVSSWDFSPDSGTLAVSYPDSSLSVLELATWQEARRLPLHSYVGFRFLPGGTRFAGVPGEDDRVEIADLATGKILDTFMAPDRVYSMATSADGRSIAAGTDGGHIYVWNTATGDRLDIDAHANEVSRLVFNHAGTLLGSLSRDSFRLWDSSTGHLIINAPGDGALVQFSDDDQYLAYADQWHISVCEIATHPVLRLLGRSNRELGYWPAPAFSPDSRLLATTEEEIHLWDPAAGKELAIVPQYGRAHFRPDGKSLIVSRFSQGLCVWPTECSEGDSNVIRLGPVKYSASNHEFGLSTDLSLDGRLLVAAQFRKSTALLYDFDNPTALVTLGPHSNISSTAISPDGHYVATAGLPSSGVKLWDVPKRQLVKELPDSVFRVAFSPDGRWLATRGEENRLYAVGSWESHLRLAVSQDDPWGPFALSPDGEIWAIASSPHGTQLYSTATGQRLLSLEPPHQARIASISFSPDGATLAVFQRDHVLQLWNLRLIRKQLATLNLDWSLPPYATPASPRDGKPIRVEFIEEPAATERRAFLAREIPPRPANGSPHLVDLSSFYNAAFTESWHEDVSGNDLRELTPGVHELAGIPFDVRGLIQLGGPSIDERGYPWQHRDIRVNQVCSRLHFLHSAIFADKTPSGTAIGGYWIHFADGRYDNIPIVTGTDVLDWFSQPQENLTNIVVAWTGQNEKSRKTGRNIRLFKTTWKNPFPSVPITRVDFEGGVTDARLFLVAITVE